MQEIFLERTYRYKVTGNSRPQALQIIGQSKAFY